MSHDDQKSVTGEVTDIFAHRFVVRTESGKILADLGPEGAEQVRLKQGDRVALAGDMKPSELKVSTIARNDAPPVTLNRRKEHHPRDNDEVDPGPALKAVEAGGFEVLGQPRRKPKHFEILGRDAAGDLVELHVELDGMLRRTRPVQDADPKWTTEIHGGL